MLCACGCKRETSIAKLTNARYGHKAGHPVTFIRGHVRRKYGHGYEVKDCGYTSPCWVWNGHTVGGYGKIWENGKEIRAHRIFYERRYGAIEEGLQIDHLCFNRPCVNPDHLEVVTQTENCRRRLYVKLTMEKAMEIRTLAKGGMKNTEIGRRYGVSKVHVGRILKNISWKTNT